MPEKSAKYDYYDSLLIRYMEADDETKKQSKEHWLKCHIENVKSNRYDMCVFTSHILSLIALADNGKAAEYLKAAI